MRLLFIALLVGSALGLGCGSDPVAESDSDLVSGVDPVSDVGLVSNVDSVSDVNPVLDAEPVSDVEPVLDVEPVSDVEPVLDVDDPPTVPVADPAVAARAFQLYYRERVERAVVAHQRYGVFGDVAFAAAIDGVHVAVSGDEIEVIGGPNDNNLIGTSVFTTWEAYRQFGGRLLELAVIRLFDGLAFYESVSGHPGMTSREVLPGWTRVVDGPAGTVSRTRFGETVTPPWPRNLALEAEMIATFWSDKRFTYRENPAEYLFSWSPAASVTEYAKTTSFDHLPDYIHVSNCCSSFKRTPDDRPWGGAFWGNHNSRDNFPDLMLGVIAAMDAAGADGIAEEVTAAAERATEAGHRIADLALANGNALMTVDEWNDYETLVVGGTIRPHGEPENEDLGSISSCPMAFLAQALTTEGLAAPVVAVPLGVNPESVLLGSAEVADLGIECPMPDGPPQCKMLGDAYCGLTWATMEDLEVLGMPWLELAAMWDEIEPGKAAEFLGGFQNDYDDVVESMAAVVLYAQVVGKEALETEALEVLGDLTDLMRLFAEVVWASTQPDEQIKQRYEAAIFDAWAGREVHAEDLRNFERAEERIAQIESRLDAADTAPWPLKTDQELYDAIEANLAGEKLDMVVQRYRDSYGDTPPIRRDGDGYEARGFPLDKRPWTAVENPRHVHMGSMKLLQALPLCRTAPHLLDCTWAVLGCEHVDRDGSGVVDEADRPDFSAEQTEVCDESNAWCDAADLDRTGTVDATDETFFEAAQGCHYDP